MGLLRHRNKGAISDSSDIEKEIDIDGKDIKSDRIAWLGVIGAFLFLMSTYGFMTCLGVMQPYLLEHELKDSSSMAVGWILGAYLFCTLASGYPISLISDKFSPTILGLFAAVLSTATPLLLAQCKVYWHFMLCLGFFASIGTSVGGLNALGLVTKLPVRSGGLAMGITVCGVSIGGVIYPIMLRTTFDKHGWAWSMRILALIIACLSILGSLCFFYTLRRLGPLIEAQRVETERIKGQASDEDPQTSGNILAAFKSWSFIITTFGLCLVEFVLYSTNGHLPAIGKAAGFSEGDTYQMIAMMNGVSSVGRIFGGPLGDAVGPFNAMIGNLLLMIVFLSTLFKPSNTNMMWAFTGVWGFSSGAFAVLSPLCTKRLCGPQIDVTKYFGFTNLWVAITLLAACPTTGPLLQKLGAPNLAYFCLGLLGAATVFFLVAKMVLFKNPAGLCKKT
ncbi:hypothetical protein ACHAPJ_012875 [Fusarium lateritium]